MVEKILIWIGQNLLAVAITLWALVVSIIVGDFVYMTSGTSDDSIRERLPTILLSLYIGYSSSLKWRQNIVDALKKVRKN